MKISDSEHFRLVEKYNTPAPRYTSYPTALKFKSVEKPTTQKKILFSPKIKTSKNQKDGISIYIHIPFCDSLCSFCGCTTFITKNHKPIFKYLSALKKEITSNTFSDLNQKPSAKSIHFGGGSPSMLSIDELAEILDTIRKRFSIDATSEVSIEVDPRDVTVDTIAELKTIGFNRLSMGVQDFNIETQKAINRIHTFEQISELVTAARENSFAGINIDLIYGLPHQNRESFMHTLKKVSSLDPDRIAVFSYAHVPWMKKHQSLIKEDELPEAQEKLLIFREATEFLEDRKYNHIGMDHFAKKEDELSILQSKNRLSRNFQGYSPHGHLPLFGFGLSAISQTEDGYIQNTKDFEEYYKDIENGIPPVSKILELNWEDRLRRTIIMEILCHMKVDFKTLENDFDIVFTAHFSKELERLKDLEKDGILRLFSSKIEVTPKGKFFIRNVAMIFDEHLQNNIQKQYSKTI